MSRILSRLLAASTPLVLAAIISLPGAAQRAVAPAASGPSASGTDSLLFAALQWRNIGPNRGGRSIGVAGATSRPLEYYFGATGGGLWKTTDGGTTWEPVTDGKITSSSVGAVAVCESNPDVVYIGTGETQLRGNIMQGDGVYKTTDAGRTWRHIGLRETQNISRVRIHPTDCDQVLVGAFGHHGAPNQERGVFRSTDGGATWTKTLYRDDKSGAVDISIDPKNPNTVYAALWEAWRKPWGMSSGGPGSGLFKSTNGGVTWTEISRNPGLPRGMLGKIGVAVSPVDANRVYAIVEADSGGVFRSDDGGGTWTLSNDERKLRQRAFYYTRIFADPVVRDRVYVLNVGMFRSDDAGKTFNTQIRPPHSDQHDLWIAANDNQRMINGNDGGGNVSVNGGRTWTEQDYPTAQMYRVGTTSHTPFFACGGQQDNSTVCVPSKSGWDHLSATNDGVFFAVGGGESGYVAPHPTNTNVYFAGSYGGTLDRFDFATGQSRAVNVFPDNPMGYSAIDIKERFQWTFPIVFSPHDPNVIYTSSQHVWRSTNEGQSWERISPDLTRADPKTLGPSGGPITLDQTGVETYGTVFTIAPSPVDRNLIWTGSDDGLIHVTRDAGKTWTKVGPPDMPEYMRIGTVEASPHKAGTAYVAGNRYLLDDFTPYLYRTDDYGRTWVRITNGIPAGHFLRSVREDKVRPGLLYAGTEKGVYISWNNGLSWRSLSLNLPVTQISDLAVEDQDLVISTHGRSFWVLPNIGLLRQLGDVVRVSELSGGATKAVHLFAPAPAIRGIDPGVTVDYYLDRVPNALTLEFLDASGRVIRSFTGRPTPAPAAARADSARAAAAPAAAPDGARTDSIRADSVRRAAAAPAPQGGPGGAGPVPTMRAGTNRFVWNLQYPGFTTFPGMILWAAGNNGPVAVPGRYQVRLTVDGQAQTQPFEVKIDPRLTGVTVADLQKRFDLAIELRDRVSQANEAVIAIRNIKSQVDERIKTANKPDVSRAGEALKQNISAVEGELYQVRNRSNQDPLNYPIKLNNKIAALMGVVESAEAPPTAQSQEVFRDLSAKLDAELAKLNAVYGRDLDSFNRLLQQNGLPQITRPPIKM
jgi:photosystem II stability/assembly factor-like uncharacterized protein